MVKILKKLRLLYLNSKKKNQDDCNSQNVIKK